jgi:hypothetical protein
MQIRLSLIATTQQHDFESHDEACDLSYYESPSISNNKVSLYVLSSG